MSDKGNSRTEAFIVFAIVLTAAALLSAWLTFSVQFERKKEPIVEKPKAASLQTLHIKEQERKQLHDHYHLGVEDKNLDVWADKSHCIVCHSPYPHGRTRQAQAIINLHTEFLACNSCHLKHDQSEDIQFAWIHPSGTSPTDKPYGTEIDAQTGHFVRTDNHLSKLAPQRKVNGQWQTLETEKGVDKAFKYMADKERLSAEQKKAVEDELHKGTELKEFVKCSQCHSIKGVMRFQELGFDAARTNQLQRMEMGGMLTNYDTFYFPDLFEKKFK